MKKSNIIYTILKHQCWTVEWDEYAHMNRVKGAVAVFMEESMIPWFFISFFYPPSPVQCVHCALSLKQSYFQIFIEGSL